MNRRKFLKNTTLASSAILLSDGMFSCMSHSATQKKGSLTPQAFDTVGFYVFQDCNESLCKFWAEIGINVIEFLDANVGYTPGSDKMNTYIAEMTEKIAVAKKYGIKSYIIFMSNILPDMSTFDTANKEKMDHRLFEIEYIIKALPEAAGFTLFAGDPGGLSGLEGSLGLPIEGSLSMYTDMARKVYALVRKYAPHADFNANIWAVSAFIRAKYSPFKADFWLSEGELGREIIAMDDFLAADFGIEIPGHDYYRPLAFNLYRSENKYPKSFFPDAEDVAALKRKNVKNRWGWCYFLMDETNDGDNLVDASNLPNPTTRYIHQYVSKMREIGMSGIIAGYTRYLNYLNLFAFGRMAHDPNLTPQDVLREFAGYLVVKEDADTLFEILKFMDNKSTWEMKMPKEEKLPLFDTRISSAEEALARLAQLRPIPAEKTAISLFDFPEPKPIMIGEVEFLKLEWKEFKSPEQYLLILQTRLQALNVIASEGL